MTQTTTINVGGLAVTVSVAALAGAVAATAPALPTPPAPPLPARVPFAEIPLLDSTKFNEIRDLVKEIRPTAEQVVSLLARNPAADYLSRSATIDSEGYINLPNSGAYVWREQDTLARYVPGALDYLKALKAHKNFAATASIAGIAVPGRPGFNSCAVLPDREFRLLMSLIQASDMTVEQVRNLIVTRGSVRVTEISGGNRYVNLSDTGEFVASEQSSLARFVPGALRYVIEYSLARLPAGL